MAKAEKPTMLFRTAAIERAALNLESREIPLSFASEQPVARMDWETGQTYQEVLDCSSEKSADFSRLNGGGALLREHRRDQQIGVVVPGSAKLDLADKKARCVVRLSRSPLGETEFQDIKDGIRTLVSVGYNTGRELSREKRDGVEVRRFEFTPYEVSTVSIPADTSVGVGREGLQTPDHRLKTDLPVDAPALPDVTQLTPEQKTALRAKLMEPTAPIVLDEPKIRSAAIGDEKKRSKEILASLEAYVKDHGTKDEGKLGEKLRTLANECLFGENPTSIGEFQRRAMEEVIKAKPAKQVRMADLGYDERERNSYSIVRAIQNCLKRDAKVPDPDTIEGDAHVRMSKLDLGFSPAGFLVPADANINPRSLSRSERVRMQRDLIATNFGSGGATVATELLLPVIEILRNMMITDRLGVRTLSGLQGNVVIPRQTAAATAYSVSEIAALTLSTQVLDQIAMTPHRVGAYNQYSKQLLLQSSMDVENFIRDDLLQVIAIDWDRLTLNGQGAASEPLGILNTPGIGSITFGAAATYAKLVAMETAVNVQNVPEDTRGYATSSAAKGVLKSAAKLLVGATTVAAEPIWNGDRVNDSPAFGSQQVPNNLMLYGRWSDCIKCLWGGFDIVVNPFTLDTNAEVRITMNTWGDVVLRHAQSFCVSADSAAQ